MTTRTDRPPTSDECAPISTTELLTAIADLGPTWPARFGDHEITDVSEALARELKAGTLLDAITLSPQGRRLLRASP